MNLSEAEKQFDALKREILKLGFVRPGSLVRRFTPCGNPNCSCMARPPKLHGPYFQWTYKVAGKTKTLRLSREQAKLCERWTRNHKRLKRLIHMMEVLSLKETNLALGVISHS